MGYRSDVAYTIRVRAPGTFFIFLAEAKSKEEYKIALDEAIVDEKNLTINFYCENTKWYEGYPHVQSHMALWKLAVEYSTAENSPLAGIFIEVGEDIDDVKDERFGDYEHNWLRVQRGIARDW